MLVDGGTLNNLPVGVAENLGANYLIVVDLVPPPVAPLQRPENIFEMWSLSFSSVMRARYLDAHLADVHI